jgi:hypothetical protein
LRAAPAPKEFSVALSNLTDWAKAVVVTLDGVHIEGHSAVHTLVNDCEMHLGAHASSFQGVPDGLVLEPMNACVDPFPGSSAQSDADWTKFGDRMVGSTVTASGVPRIWPEHLDGGTASNPDHAVELHPLATIAAPSGENRDFSKNILAGDYRGGVGEATALKIVQQLSVTVARNGASASISFQAGTIGNFTVLDIIVNRTSIASDGAGSFRMDGSVVIDSSTTVPVHIVTAKGSPVNDEIQQEVSGGHGTTFEMDAALVLFSLSPQALLDAANSSHGAPVAVVTPLQLILYGPTDEKDGQ